ncbi:MAG: hypothetical protein GQ527_12410 [Bacteroidales bacterium]|nr:hypothetical protein [Bacteroidales bacterium]
MKGLVFTEFIEFVEGKFGFEISDQMITASELKSGGVYTAVGTYEFKEMQSLLMNLHKETKIPLPILLETYGSHLFYKFVEMFPQFVDKSKSLFHFISGIDQYIHVEVKKLYPDAELPKIIVDNSTDEYLKLTYISERKLGYFALGLLKSAIKCFQEKIEIEMEFKKEDGSEVQFTLKKV